MQTTINVQSFNNLGDNIINFIFFKQIKEYIESNNIIIHYRCKAQYHKNLSDFKYSKNIIILPWENIGYVLWQATVFNLIPQDCSAEDMLCLMFNIFLKKGYDTINIIDLSCRDRYKLQLGNYLNKDDIYKCYHNIHSTEIEEDTVSSFLI